MLSCLDDFQHEFKISKNERVKNYEGYSLSAFKKDKRVLNFSPGPTALPKEIMKNMIEEINNEWILGVTPLEISHRSPEFLQIKDNCEQLFKELLEIPNDFSLLWSHGGGHGQFSAVPLNLVENLDDAPNYIVTGTWSKRSFIEALKFCKPLKSTENDDISEINKINKEFLNESVKKVSKYIYICSNETINGLEFREDGLKIPSKEDTNNKIMIVDMSSDILSKKVNWKNIDVAFACAPKNFGFPGSTITIIHNDLLKEDYQNYYKNIPSLLDWKLIKNSASFWNTLPVFNIYITEKILQYYKNIGGLTKIQEYSKIKADLIYSILDDENTIYEPIVSKDREERSRMNIPFFIKDKEMMESFLHNAYMNNIVGLRTKTPFNNPDKPEALRISLYNPISVNDTIILCSFMKTFNEIVYLNTKNT